MEQAVESSDPAQRFQLCSECKTRLPLRHPVDDEVAVPWKCTGCDKIYEAVFDQDFQEGTIANVRPVEIQFEAQKLPQPVETVERCILQLAKNGNFETERRETKRFDYVKAVPVLKVDEHFHSHDEPFMAMTRNISTTGMSLFHSEAIDSKHLVVELPISAGEPLKVGVEVIRCREVGGSYEIGGHFVVRFS